MMDNLTVKGVLRKVLCLRNMYMLILKGDDARHWIMDMLITVNCKHVMEDHESC